MKRDNFMIPNNAVAAAYPPPLDEVGRPQRLGSVAFVTAFGVVGWGHPFRQWLVSALCPFGCSAVTHTFACRCGRRPAGEYQFEYCPIADAFYSVIIPESLRLAALHVTAVES